MGNSRDVDMFARELYLAGERVVPGHYEQLGSSRVVDLDLEGFLPASLDGRVACFVRAHQQWGRTDPSSPEHTTRNRVAS